MDVRAIEQAARLAWPALEEQDLPFGMLRYTGGSERRTNSLSLHPGAVSEPGEMIEAAEKFFDQRAAVPVVRIVRCARTCLPMIERLDRDLARRGYERQAPTLTLVKGLACDRGLDSALGTGADSVVDLEGWLQAWYTLTGKPFTEMELHSRALQGLDPANTQRLQRSHDGQPLSTGMGVLTGELLGLYGIATASDRRRQGLASALLRALLQWASVRGARCAYLQVEEANEAAIRLYQKLGFRKLYSYWYRVGKRAVANQRMEL